MIPVPATYYYKVEAISASDDVQNPVAQSEIRTITVQ
jgi:hypothetical protein